MSMTKEKKKQEQGFKDKHRVADPLVITLESEHNAGQDNGNSESL